jgi:hypothetical protein
MRLLINPPWTGPLPRRAPRSSTPKRGGEYTGPAADLALGCGRCTRYCICRSYPGGGRRPAVLRRQPCPVLDRQCAADLRPAPAPPGPRLPLGTPKPPVYHFTPARPPPTPPIRDAAHRSSWRHGSRGSEPAAARPRRCDGTAGRWRVDSGRTPTRPGPADRLDSEALAVLIDERAHFGRSGSSSLAKNTLADLRISFARRSS